MRKGQLILLVCVLVLLAACRPKGILSSRQMRNVMYDLHRADAILQVEGYNYGHDEEVAKYYQVVLDKHRVTKAEFDSSLVWYTDHPQLFNRIYPKILKRCQQEKDYWNALEEQEKSVSMTRRDLPPIEDVLKTLQLGYDTRLVPDSLLETPEDTELLLPIGRQDSISSAVAVASVSDDTAVSSETVTPVRDTSEDIIDGKTPAERRREEQLKRMHERFKLKLPTEK